MTLPWTIRVLPRGALDIRITRPLTRAEVQAFVAAVEMGERMMNGVRAADRSGQS